MSIDHETTKRKVNIAYAHAWTIYDCFIEQQMVRPRQSVMLEWVFSLTEDHAIKLET